MMKKRIVVFIAFFIFAEFFLSAQSPRIISATSIALRGDPKYKDGFTHFDYVNPDAPKGGNLTQHVIGTYDSFHRYALRGDALSGPPTDFYDTLLTGSWDEVESYYPLVAERIEYAEDFSFIIFHINPNAKAQDGVPITADDVVFSFNTFFEKGVPQFKRYYEGVQAKALDTLRVRFDLPRPDDKELLLAIFGIKILPKHFWETRDFSEPLSTPPLGTGPYRVKDYKMGQYVIYERIPDYWATDIPSRKGTFNFDTFRYDFYRDATVAMEAFKAGEYDIRFENIAMNWATQYNDLNSQNEDRKIITEEIPHQIPQPMQAFIFNTERAPFNNRLVRQALNYVFDFEWMNKYIFYDAYERTRSYFQNTEYEAFGLPSAKELEVLEPIRDQIASEVFTQEYNSPVTDGTGNIRPQMREAIKLFKEAGWELQNGKMIDSTTGERMSFELLSYSPTDEKIAVPFQRNLARYGIDMKIRLVDPSQYINRIRIRDYDITPFGYSANPYPSSSLLLPWHSDYIDSTYNIAGVRDSAIDYLVEEIAANQNDDKMLLALGRALDRVLTWNFYVIPHWYTKMTRVAYVDKFDRPEILAKYDSRAGLYTWWVK
jgi:microcin C transport system substrate-binding protein